MAGFFIVVIVGALAVMATLAWLAHLAEKKRTVALAALAARIGWRFDPSRDRGHDREYGHFEIFSRGHSRAAHNTLAGTVEIDGRVCPVKMGDFVYKVTTRSGKSSRTRTYRFSYLIVDLPWHGVPDLLIRREGILDKVAGALGFDDIDFESAEFSRRFHVKGHNRRFAYAVVDPRMMEFLMGADPACIDLEDGRCCLADGRRRWEPTEFERCLALVRGFLDRWPEHVKASLRGQPVGPA